MPTRKRVSRSFQRDVDPMQDPVGEGRVGSGEFFVRVGERRSVSTGWVGSASLCACRCNRKTETDPRRWLVAPGGEGRFSQTGVTTIRLLLRSRSCVGADRPLPSLFAFGGGRVPRGMLLNSGPVGDVRWLGQRSTTVGSQSLLLRLIPLRVVQRCVVVGD